MAKTAALKKGYTNSAADVLAAVNQGTKAKQSGKKRVNVEISDETYRGLKAIAALHEETLTDYVNNLFRDTLDRNREALNSFNKAMKRLNNEADEMAATVERATAAAKDAANVAGQAAEIVKNMTPDQQQALLDALQETLNK